jgi:uncharacterized membrane protein
MHVRNPVEWGVDQLRSAGHVIEAAGRGHYGTQEAPAIRRIEVADLVDCLARGVDDFAAARTDVIFLALVYPVAGLVLARLAFGYDMLPLMFPLVSGFALIGPLAAVGLYEMSRRREQGVEPNWADAFGLVHSRSFPAIVGLGIVLLAIFLLWLGAAMAIYGWTLGPEAPVSLGAFVHDVFETGAGWALIGIGIGVGFVFAVLALAVGVVSFPLLVDRDVGFDMAVATSVRAVAANPLPMAVWGLIVAGALVLGSVPLLLGLVVVMPVLGHATWHLYRKVVAPR